MKKKHILKLFILGVFVSLTTGCADINSYIDNFTSDMEDRLSMNQQQVDRLEEAGLLSKQSADSLRESIGNQNDRMTEMSEGKVSEVACKAFGLGDVKALNSYHINGDSRLHNESFSIVSEDSDAMKELRDNLEFEVYVLKKDPRGLGTGENSIATLDLISNAVKQASENKTSAGSKGLDAYFVSTGKKVWDLSDPENQITRDTYDNPEWDRGHNYTSSNVMGLNYIGVKVEVDDNGVKNQVAGVEIVLHEFNVDAIDRLLGSDGVNKDKYVIIGNRCYLMEYPVYYVSGFKQEGNNFTATYEKSDMRINILTKQMMDSQGRVCTPGNNEGIYSVVGGTSEQYTDLGQASFIVDGLVGEEPKDGYLPEGATIENKGLFGRVVLRDYLELSYMPGVVDGESLVAVGRRMRLTKFKGEGDQAIGLFIDRQGNKIENSMDIMITDVMDVAQGIPNGEKYKLNIKESKTDDSSDSNGDINEGHNSTGDTNNSTDNSNSNESLTSVNGVGVSQDRLLNEKLVSEIKCTTIFPGSIVATSDSIDDLTFLGNDSSSKEDSDSSSENTEDTDNTENTEGTDGTETGATSTGDVPKIKQFFYAMALDIDPFQSNMFSGWINNTDTDAPGGSLDWWNKWLRESSYIYQVDRDKLLRFLTGNYAFEMNSNDYIVLDIPTISAIQKEYDLQDKESSSSWITTIFTILGFLVISYSVVMLGAWVYDTNVVAGPRLLGFISGGKWEAITDTDELPNMDKDGKHYMTFSKVLKSAVVLIGMGILLIFVDIVSIVDILVVTFGKIAEIFSNTLKGI